MKWTDKHRKVLWIFLTPLLPILYPLGYLLGRYKEWEGKRHDAKYHAKKKREQDGENAT